MRLLPRTTRGTVRLALAAWLVGAALLWGTLPIGSSILALILFFLLPDRRRTTETIEFPLVTTEQPVLREAR